MTKYLMEITREVGMKGQVVIPIDIRRMLKLKPKSKVVFKVENNSVRIEQQDSRDWLNEFSNYKGKLKRENIKKSFKEIIEEQYEENLSRR
jgi:AbrB family looped-hinge helix DNA binding protein